MKQYYYITIAVVLLLASGCHTQHRANKHTPDGGDSTHLTKTMETAALSVKKGGVEIVEVPNRGAAGLQLVYTADNDSLLRVERLPPDSTAAAAGQSVGAKYKITALQPGVTAVVFSEKRVGMPGAALLPVKKIVITIQPE